MQTQTNQDVQQPKLKAIKSHQESDIKIYVTSDYSKFKFIPGNRDESSYGKKVERIEADVKTGNDILKNKPINVYEENGYLWIDDGQARFTVSKRLRKPIYYIIGPKLSISSIGRLNSNQEKWTDTDFINAYIKAGKSDYVKLKNFKQTYGFSTGASLKLLSGGRVSHVEGGVKFSLRYAFERGEFKVMNLADATRMADQIKQFDFFKGYSSQYFVSSILKILTKDLIDITELLNKCKRNKDMLDIRGSSKEYLSLLEDVYNVGKQKRFRIY